MLINTAKYSDRLQAGHYQNGVDVWGKVRVPLPFYFDHFKPGWQQDLHWVFYASQLQNAPKYLHVQTWLHLRKQENLCL